MARIFRSLLRPVMPEQMALVGPAVFVAANMFKKKRCHRSLENHRSHCTLCACESASQANMRDAVRNMHISEIKRELQASGISTAGMLEKIEFVEALMKARNSGVAQGDSGASHTQASKEVDSVNASRSHANVATPKGDERLESIQDKCRAMSVRELRSKLAARGMSWADAFDKDELVARLATVLAKEAEYCISGRIKPGTVQQLSGADLMEELQDGGVPLLLDVFATWCGPCSHMAPELERCARRIGSRAKFVKLDADQDSALASQFQVSSLPTLILFDHRGKEVARHEGAMSEAQLIDFLEGQIKPS